MDGAVDASTTAREFKRTLLNTSADINDGRIDNNASSYDLEVDPKSSCYPCGNSSIGAASPMTGYDYGALTVVIGRHCSRHICSWEHVVGFKIASSDQHETEREATS